MVATRSRFLFPIILLLVLGLPGTMGYWVGQDKAPLQDTDRKKEVFQTGSTHTPAPDLKVTPFPASTSTGFPVIDPALPFDPFILGLYTYIQAPPGPLTRPYVIINASGSSARRGSVEIRGFFNSQEFICKSPPCVIFLQDSSRFVFRAYNTSGDISEEVISSVTVRREQSGFFDNYFVTIDSVSLFNLFTDSCSIIWGLADEKKATWDTFVQFPFQLNTKKTLHLLTTRLILNGIVDAGDCPAGGLNIGLDWPTACGLERASGKATEWQNQFDDNIWLASRDYGIPPKIIKTLIEVESQYWPGNQRFYLDEFGLGQINQLGVDILLRNDPGFYRRFCTNILSDCTQPYQSLDSTQQSLIRGAVVRSVDAVCSECPNGVDLNRARESISLIAMLLRANCQQVDTILDSAARTYSDPDVDAATATSVVATANSAGINNSILTYEDLWRFTLVAYHSGISCFQESVIATKKAGLSVTWENLKDKFTCRGGPEYVDGLMGTLFSFDSYLYEQKNALSSLATPEFVPTRTPIPTPTVMLSTARINVQVFMDRNGDSTPGNDEWIEAITVLLATSGNEQITQRTKNGIAVFDMSQYPPGTRITVSLPGLYRSESFVLPQSGEITITFKFDQPALPTFLP